MGSVSVSSRKCCMFVSCVHPVEVINASFCMPCSLLMLLKDARGDHIYGRGTLQSLSHYCLVGSHECLLLFTHPVAVSSFMICSGVCACTEMSWMCELYVSFWSKVRPRTFGCVAISSALFCIFKSRLLVYSAGSGVNRVQVVLSGFSMILFCFVQAKTFCRYGCIYFLAALVLVCVDVIVISFA